MAPTQRSSRSGVGGAAGKGPDVPRGRYGGCPLVVPGREGRSWWRLLPRFWRGFAGVQPGGGSSPWRGFGLSGWGGRGGDGGGENSPGPPAGPRVRSLPIVALRSRRSVPRPPNRFLTASRSRVFRRDPSVRLCSAGRSEKGPRLVHLLNMDSDGDGLVTRNVNWIASIRGRGQCHVA